MRCISNELSKDFTTIVIELFYDIHIGSNKCDLKLLRERIDDVANTPNKFAILGGDIINNSTKTSVGDVYGEQMSPMEQVKLATTMFYPIKDKILGATAGNHERRTYKQDGIDLMMFMCNELGIVDKYDYCSIVNFVKFGSAKNTKNRSKMFSAGKSIQYVIYFTHGDGNGGRTVGGKANGLERRGNIVDADVIITGHTHQPLSFRTMSFRASRTTKTVTPFEQVYVNASANLDYEEYAELYGLRPSSKASPKIILDGTTFKIAVTM